jgi:hypothetical protein
MKKESYQLNISLSLTNGEESGFTLNRFMTGIGQPRAFECQLLPTAMGRIHRRWNSSMQWHVLSLALWSLATRLTRAVKRSFVNGSFRLSLMIGGNKSLFPHDASLCISTRIHLSWDPFQQLLKKVGIYLSRWWRCRESPIPS